jgi:hypothetical protein
MAITQNPVPAGLVTQISGTDGSVSVTTPSGNRVELSAMFPAQAPTASAPPYVKGAIYFDTTLNKLRVGGAAAWETITSA